MSIPASVTDIGNSLDSITNSMTIVIDEDNKNYVNKDGIIYNSDLTELIRVNSGFEDEEFTVPDTVKTIHKNAFNGSEKLKKITIPASVTTIDNSAFRAATLWKALMLTRKPLILQYRRCAVQQT